MLEGPFCHALWPDSVTVGSATVKRRSLGCGAVSSSRPEGANLAVHLSELARSSGWWDRPAILSGAAGWTHGEVHAGAAATAALLADDGVEPGDRVLIALDDGPWFVLAVLGAMHRGAIAVPVNPGLSPAEHAWLVQDAEPAVVVAEPEAGGGLLALAGGDGARSGWALLGPEEVAGALSSPRSVEPVAVGPETPAYAQYTSGTTGRPKAALHRHRDPRCYYEAMGVAALGLVPQDVLLSVSKAYFAYGLGNSVFFPLFSGAAAVLDAGRPTPAGVSELASEHRPSLLFAVPSFYALLVARGERSAFGSLRGAVSAGETLSPALLERATAWLRCPVLDGLGSTEVGQTFVSNTFERHRPGTVGVPLPGYEVSVRVEEGPRAGREVDRGETGSLWVRGDSVLIGYRGRPAETAAVLRDGWLCTGDRASIDEDGFVHHAGRSDDMEMVGGITVSPLEVEAVMGAHPAVAEVAVAAVADEEGATRLRAFVVPAPGEVSEGRDWRPDLEQALLELVRASHAPYKVPRSVRFVEALPRTPTGKLQRFALRAGWPDAGAGVALGARPGEGQGGADDHHEVQRR